MRVSRLGSRMKGNGVRVKDLGGRCRVQGPLQEPNEEGGDSIRIPEGF